MFKYFVFLLALLFTAVPTLAGDDTCSNLKSFEGLDCKDSGAVYSALSELHSCMKSRFTYKEIVHAAAWPMVEVPESGPVVGGYGEWAVACLQAWPCKKGRLAFVEKTGGVPYLAMVSNKFIVDFNLDKVYEKKDLSDYRILKVSGLKPDQPWFKVDQ